MIISDLNHVDVVSEETETSIEGGFPYGFFYNFPTIYAPPPAFAGANSPIIYTSTFTSTVTPLGYGGSASSSSTVSYCWWQ